MLWYKKTIGQIHTFLIKYFHSFREAYAFTDLHLFRQALSLILTKFNDLCFEPEEEGKTLTQFDQFQN